MSDHRLKQVVRPDPDPAGPGDLRVLRNALADGLSHDLNSGLTAIGLVLESLAATLDPAERQLARRAGSTVQTLLKRADQVRWLTAEGRREQRRVDAHFLLEIAARLVRDRWPGVAVELDYEKSSPPLAGRPMDLLRALSEAVATLAEATDSGPLRLALACSPEDPDLPLSFELSVVDATWGQLAPERLHSIATAASAGGGRLMRADDDAPARIRIQIEPAHGTPGSEAGPPTAGVTGQFDPATGKRGTKTINGQPLVVLAEDDQGTRSVLRTILQQMGCRVLTCDDGRTALRHLRSGKRLDLLISDLTLPGISGSSLVREARELHPDLPIVAMSGEASGLRQLEKEKFHVQVFLTKPFPAVQLAGIAERLLRGD